MKEKIRSIYAELQGYLEQIPDNLDTSTWTRDKVLWEQLNFAIDELNKVSGKDYSRFKITPESGQVLRQSLPYQNMRYSTYKANLGGLIAKLHAEYFRDEEPPFRNMPGTVITQTQMQTQSINMILDIQEKILSELPKHEEGTKERTFLEKVKSTLPNIKTGMDIISTILKLGSETGLHISDVQKLLHL